MAGSAPLSLQMYERRQRLAAQGRTDGPATTPAPAARTPSLAPILSHVDQSTSTIVETHGKYLSVELGDPKRVYTPLDHIIGSVSFKDVTLAATKVRRSKPYEPLFLGDKILVVSLLGVQHVSFQAWSEKKNAYVNRSSEWTFLRQAQVVHLPSVDARAPFAFELPAMLQPHQCPLGDLTHLSLPPSCGDVDDFGKAVAAGPYATQVVYMIKAELKHFGSVYCMARQKFSFFPTHAQRPDPRWMEQYDARHDSVTSDAASKVVESGFGKKAGVLKYRALCATLTTSDDDTASTSPLTLLLSFTGPKPPSIEKIRLNLFATTVKRTEHRHANDRQPEHTNTTVKELGAFTLDAVLSKSQWTRTATKAPVNRALSCMSVLSDEQEVTDTQWQQNDTSTKRPTSLRDRALSFSTVRTTSRLSGPSNTSSKAEIPVWRMRCTIPVTLPAGERIVPSFESCLVARRYRVQLLFHLAGLQTVLFMVPVWLCRRGEPQGVLGRYTDRFLSGRIDQAYQDDEEEQEEGEIPLERQDMRLLDMLDYRQQIDETTDNRGIAPNYAQVQAQLSPAAPIVSTPNYTLPQDLWEWQTRAVWEDKEERHDI